MSVPDRFHISWQNDFTAFTLASDVAAEAAYPLTNCQSKTANMPTVWDMSEDSSIAITGSSATQRTSTCFAVHRHTLQAGDTVRLRLYAGEDQSGTLVYDSGLVDAGSAIPFGSIIAGIDGFGNTFEETGNITTHKSIWFESVVYRSFQIDIAVTDPVNDEVAIDKFWLGYAHCPQYGPEWGFGSSLVDESEHQRKVGGGIETVDVPAYRRLQMDFKGLEQWERHVLRNILDRAKKSGDLLITMDPNDALSLRYETSSIYRRTSDASFIGAHYNWNELGLAVEEN